MRVVRRALRSALSADEALLLLAERARLLGNPPPAALCGDWFGSRAVLVPSVRAAPRASAAEAFAVPVFDRPIHGPPGSVGGGWVGYLGYGLTDPSGRPNALPDAAWGWAGHVLRLDRRGQWWFEAIDEADPQSLADVYQRLLSAGPPRPVGWTPAVLHRPLRAEHERAVRRCITSIEAGELYQANICSRFHGTFDGSPEELFAAGVRQLRARRSAFLAGKWGAVVSFSPELFLARHGDVVRSTPIKGTMPRRGPADDGNAARLRRSEKDVAENVMITDLVRNDLGRVSRTGSVAVTDLLSVRPAPGVWHLESTVESRLADGVDEKDLLVAAFPPGSVTGAPKLRALELIAELEPESRGVYCGAVGFASPVAGLELNVAIRTFELSPLPGGAHAIALGVGGGITASSEPGLEWHECLHKAAPLERLLTSGGRASRQSADGAVPSLRGVVAAVGSPPVPALGEGSH
jgi:para-aminobenzoate synthetase component 1